jgi:Ca2+-binding EF-hand superfamily protein
MKTIPVSLVIAGSLLGASALPAPDRPEGEPVPKERSGNSEGERRAGPHHPPIEFWKRADTNGDGLISREEFLALERIKKLPEEKRNKFFKRLDKNDDGAISLEELLKMAAGQNPRRPKGLPCLRELDIDHSGGVSLEEFKAAPFVQKLPAERQDTLFKCLDRDGDGLITPKDRPDGPSRHDGPGGGEMDVKQALRRLDANGDGAVTYEEFQKAPFAEKIGTEALGKRFEKLDRNGDKQLTAEDRPTPPVEVKPEPPVTPQAE